MPCQQIVPVSFEQIGGEEASASRMSGAAIVRHRESIDFRIARGNGLRVSRLFAVGCNKRSALHRQPGFGATSIAPYACCACLRRFGPIRVSEKAIERRKPGDISSIIEQDHRVHTSHDRQELRLGRIQLQFRQNCVDLQATLGVALNQY